MAARATLQGLLQDDGGLVSQVRFEWGSSRAYGMITPWQPGMSTGDTFSAELTGLGIGTYHYRAVALNGKGYGYGNDQVFSTGVQAWPISLVEYEQLHSLGVG